MPRAVDVRPEAGTMRQVVAERPGVPELCWHHMAAPRLLHLACPSKTRGLTISGFQSLTVLSPDHRWVNLR